MECIAQIKENEDFTKQLVSQLFLSNELKSTLPSIEELEAELENLEVK